MRNCAKEVHPNDWFNKEYATYGNKQNTFTSNKSPEILDYIFKRTNSLEKVAAATTSFSLPLFKTEVSMLRMLRAQNKYNNFLRKCPKPWKMYSEFKMGKAIEKDEDDCIKFMDDEKTERKALFSRSLGSKSRMTGMSLSDHESIATSIYIWKLDMH